MDPLRIVFMGTPALACFSLQALLAEPSFSVVAVVAQPDKPKGREMHSQPPPVKLLALQAGLRVLQPARAREEQFIAQLRTFDPELIVVTAYGQILPQNLLDLPKHGCINVHTSLLPKYRGAAPIQWAIANGDLETGVTIMKMDAGMDTGAILAARVTPIAPEDDSATLHDRLGKLGAELLVETIPGYISGAIRPQPQPQEGVSYAAKIKKEDGQIVWSQPASVIWNRLRAFTTWPGAYTHWQTGGKPLLLKIWKAEPLEHPETPLMTAPVVPGQIVRADQKGIVVACGQNALRITELQREGKRRQPARDFLAGNRLLPGEKFG